MKGKGLSYPMGNKLVAERSFWQWWAGRIERKGKIESRVSGSS